MDKIFHRTELLVGSEAMERLRNTRVIIFGVGGVGSWCAESLIRSGIGHLTMVDGDCVDVTNINRQLPATTATVGLPKVEVLRERLLTIHPDADIVARQERYSAERADAFPLEEYDYVIDAIDSLQDKMNLILHATGAKVKLFSSMGAAFKMDTTRIKVAEFWKVTGCPLAAALRSKFKRSQLFPKRKFKCVYSDELLRPKDAKENGTVVHITAVFGFTLAGFVIESVVNS
jgi:tRNA A37 threonylcarbamoyladenosine dehydratase